MFPDFSYRSYLQEKGIPEDQTLSSYQMKDLMEELGISEYRQRDECSKSQESFSSLLNGWKNGNFPPLKNRYKQLYLKRIFVYF